MGVERQPLKTKLARRGMKRQAATRGWMGKDTDTWRWPAPGTAN